MRILLAWKQRSAIRLVRVRSLKLEWSLIDPHRSSLSTPNQSSANRFSENPKSTTSSTSLHRLVLCMARFWRNPMRGAHGFDGIYKKMGAIDIAVVAKAALCDVHMCVPRFLVKKNYLTSTSSRPISSATATLASRENSSTLVSIADSFVGTSIYMDVSVLCLCTALSNGVRSEWIQDSVKPDLR